MSNYKKDTHNCTILKPTTPKHQIKKQTDDISLKTFQISEHIQRNHVFKYL